MAVCAVFGCFSLHIKLLWAVPANQTAKRGNVNARNIYSQEKSLLPIRALKFAKDISFC